MFILEEEADIGARFRVLLETDGALKGGGVRAELAAAD